MQADVDKVLASLDAAEYAFKEEIDSVNLAGVFKKIDAAGCYFHGKIYVTDKKI